MDNTASINIELRTSTKKSDKNQLKKNGYLLGNIVGKGITSTAIAIRKDEFGKAIRKLGRNSVFILSIPDGQQYITMVKEIHTEPLKNEITHVDFQVVSFTEKMKQEVSIKITGTELLETKRLLINSSVDSIVLEGFPQNIPDEIEIDVSDLEAGDGILAGDLKFSEGITSDLDPQQKILTVVGSKLRETAEPVEEISDPTT